MPLIYLFNKPKSFSFIRTQMCSIVLVSWRDKENERNMGREKNPSLRLQPATSTQLLKLKLLWKHSLSKRCVKQGHSLDYSNCDFKCNTSGFFLTPKAKQYTSYEYLMPFPEGNSLKDLRKLKF